MTIKETAGKMLLYFYQLQRTVPASIPYRQLGFLDKEDGGLMMQADKKWLTKDLQEINPAPTDIFNAYRFLISKGLINSVERATGGKRIYVGIQVTDTGIDIVEGIDGGQDGKHAFNAMFNISTDNVDNVEEFVKKQLSALMD